MPLPDDAVAVITALLPPGTPGREQYLAQLPHTSIARRCRCGCATTDLQVDRDSAAPAAVTDNPVASAWFPLAESPMAAGLLLFVDDGYLS